MVCQIDHRSALLVSELTGFVAEQAMKTADRENPIHGSHGPATEHMAR
jgi:hypothetical protein